MSNEAIEELIERNIRVMNAYNEELKSDKLGENERQIVIGLRDKAVERINNYSSQIQNVNMIQQQVNTPTVNDTPSVENVQISLDKNDAKIQEKLASEINRQEKYIDVEVNDPAKNAIGIRFYRILKEDLEEINKKFDPNTMDRNIQRQRDIEIEKAWGRANQQRNIETKFGSVSDQERRDRLEEKLSGNQSTTTEQANKTDKKVEKIENNLVESLQRDSQYVNVSVNDPAKNAIGIKSYRILKEDLEEINKKFDPNTMDRVVQHQRDIEIEKVWGRANQKRVKEDGFFNKKSSSYLADKLEKLEQKQGRVQGANRFKSMVGGWFNKICDKAIDKLIEGRAR